MMGLKAHHNDNVATIFEEVPAGSMVKINDPSGSSTEIKANQSIPYGHKIALNIIHKDEPVIKYGEALGIATQEIRTGDYVHVHNLNSARARGDIQ